MPWSWWPLWSPGKIPRKHIQPVAIGRSFPMPENTLDPNGIMASSAWETPTRPSSSAVNKQPAHQVPVSKTPATKPRTTGRGLAAVRLHWMTVVEAQNNPSLPPTSSGTPCVPQPVAVGSLMSSPSPFAPVFQSTPCGFRLELSAWTTKARCQGMLTSPTWMTMMTVGIKEVLDFRQWLSL